MSRLAVKVLKSKRLDAGNKSGIALPISLALTIVIGAAFGCGYSLAPQKVEPKEPHVERYHQNSYTAVDGMPELFIFAGKNWKVIADDRDWDSWLISINADGNTECDRQVIALKSTLPTAYRKEVLLHELLHVGACDEGNVDEMARYYNSKSMQDHDGIQRLSRVLSELFRENPELAQYLLGVPK